MTIVSYAQNFEDVVLWRAFSHIDEGRYVDVGAQDPNLDSISKVFFQAKWKGVHVEPTQAYADLLRADRPGDIILQSAVSDISGQITFFEIPETGLSTANAEIAANHERNGFKVVQTVVDVISLDAACEAFAGQDIHWVKIDVEGFEAQVLRSWRSDTLRPWILVIESTLPGTQIESHDQWEHLVIEKGYRFAYLDGLNRYYVSEKHPELMAKLKYPPNVFDLFQLPESAWAVRSIVKRHHEIQIAADLLVKAHLHALSIREVEVNAQHVDMSKWFNAQLQKLAEAADEREARLHDELAFTRDALVKSRQDMSDAVVNLEEQISDQLRSLAQQQVYMLSHEKEAQRQLEEASGRMRALEVDVQRFEDLVRLAQEEIFGLREERLRTESDYGSAVRDLETKVILLGNQVAELNVVLDHKERANRGLRDDIEALDKSHRLEVARLQRSFLNRAMARLSFKKRPSDTTFS